MRSFPIFVAVGLVLCVSLSGFAQSSTPTSRMPGELVSPGLETTLSPHARITSMDVSPTTNLTSSGPVGGPFIPSSQSYAVTNTGSTTLSFTASAATGTWCKVFAGGSTLAPGAGWSVVVYIDNNIAYTMLPGTYTDTITFTNTTDGSGNTTRTATLTITAGSGAGPMIVSPGLASNASGPVGGPFGPTSQTFTVSNMGSSGPLNWTVTCAASWITLSSPGGTLAAGANTTVTVTINSTANSMAAGSYAAFIYFTNTTSSYGDTIRSIGLSIVSGPFAGPMLVSPGGGLTSSGPAGGPFSPSSINYTISNGGTLSFNWVVSATKPWITLSATSGTLAPGASTTVTVSFNSAASALSAGTYSDTVSFSNVTNTSGDTTRPVSLTITGGSTAGPMTVTPATGITSTGPVGGPFSPLSQTYTVTNTGTASMNYTVAATQSWMTVLPTSGTLASGASASVTVSINGTAIFLAAGTYTDTVTFTNTTSGTGTTTRPIVLTVTTPGSGSISVTPGTGVTFSGPAGGPFVPSSATYTVSDTGSASVDVSVSSSQPWVTASPASLTLGAGANTPVTLSINSSASTLTPGTYTSTVTFTNSTSGTGTTSRTVTLIVGSPSDTTPPSISIVLPAPPTATTSSSPVTISGTASDDVAVTLVDWTNAATGGSGIASGTTSWSASVPLASGSNLITFKAHDAAGNTASASITIFLSSTSGDTTPPTITILSPAPPSATVSGSPVTVSGVANDNVAVATVTWFNAATGKSGTATGTTSWSASITLTNGANVITFSAFDTSGNSSTASITISLGAAGGGSAGASNGGGGGNHCHMGTLAAGESGSIPFAIAAGLTLLAMLIVRKR